ELSRGTTLLPGTLIVTGTPSGVGVARSPQVFLKHGDRVEVEIERLGTLVNEVVEEGR
ncbi:MAG: fumarylacetoacetate hydrolase family protein, partial [Phycisphaerae bacterium]